MSRSADTGDDMTWTYVRVVVVEILVLAALWWLGRYSA
jgi:hypothetical protein